MIDANNPAGRLMLQFLAWLAMRPRTYDETMDAWRTSCPRLSVWEDALADGLVTVDADGTATQGERAVQLTTTGHAILRAEASGPPDRRTCLQDQAASAV